MLRNDNLLWSQWIIPTRTQKRSRDETIVSIWINCLSSRAVVRLLRSPSLLWRTSISVASKYFADAFLRHTQHSHGGKCKMIRQETYAKLNRLSARRLNPKWQQLGWLPFQSVPTLYSQDWAAFNTQLVRQWSCINQHYIILQSNSIRNRPISLQCKSVIP